MSRREYEQPHRASAPGVPVPPRARPPSRMRTLPHLGVVNKAAFSKACFAGPASDSTAAETPRISRPLWAQVWGPTAVGVALTGETGAGTGSHERHFQKEMWRARVRCPLFGVTEGVRARGDPRSPRSPAGRVPLQTHLHTAGPWAWGRVVPRHNLAQPEGHAEVPVKWVWSRVLGNGGLPSVQRGGGLLRALQAASAERPRQGSHDPRARVSSGPPGHLAGPPRCPRRQCHFRENKVWVTERKRLTRCHPRRHHGQRPGLDPHLGLAPGSSGLCSPFALPAEGSRRGDFRLHSWAIRVIHGDAVSVWSKLEL